MSLRARVIVFVAVVAVVALPAVVALVAVFAVSALLADVACFTVASFDSLICVPVMLFFFTRSPGSEPLAMFLPLILVTA